MSTDKPGHTLREWQQAQLITHLIQDALDNREGEAGRVIEQDAWLGELWAAVEPEARRNTLMLAAWQARRASWTTADSLEEHYAVVLATCAARWEADHPGATWQTFRLTPHPSYSLTSSLAFDRDDNGLAWSAAVLLTAHAERTTEAGQ
ncbi:hypothetical protein [Streptomyces regalis]|uniref:Uncharacterized protein n=1 Tax=Streptomyces regalis TaxID=68262 RepID=A0A124G7N3_9ACTN|nr:hypothetical protein [Streptomyces regalis]KUL23202.1 hypothetical protein ADL12_39675 [Streptomyces regalis]